MLKRLLVLLIILAMITVYIYYFSKNPNIEIVYSFVAPPEFRSLLLR